jgi:outer membrane protein W
MSLFKAALVISLMSFPISVMGQTLPAAQEAKSADRSASESLRGKHGIELTMGLLSGVSSATKVSPGDVRTKSEANGLIGSIGYTYWLEDDWAINISAGLVDADATVWAGSGGTFVESAVVLPVLFGVKYQPPRLIDSDVVRPYVSASVGPYLGFASDVWTGSAVSVESRSETALGLRLAIGADLALSRLFRLGIGGGYHFVTDFENRIGSEKNHSTPEFSISFGIVFGKGRK